MDPAFRRRRIHMRSTNPNLPFFQTEPTPSAATNPWQAVASIIIAASAVFSIVAQSKEYPLFAWTLLIIAVIALASVSYRPVLSFLRRQVIRSRRNRVARRVWPEFLRLQNKFGNFVNSNDGSNLRPLLFRICGSNQRELLKLCPPDYLKHFYALIAERHEEPAKSEEDIALAAEELIGMVSSYNKDYVLSPFERLREQRHFRQLPQGWREDDEPDIEDFRERWVQFLDRLQEFLERVNSEMKYDPLEALTTYFERPRKL